MSRTLAFIPAKGTSQRLPRKNLLDFHGRPLVRLAVDVAREALDLGLIDVIVVESDSMEVRQAVGHDDGVLFSWRPDGWRRDGVRVIDLLRDTLEGWTGRRDMLAPVPDLVCVLLPTSPLRTVRHLVESYRMLTPETDVVLSVTPFRQDVRGALVLDGDSRVNRCAPDWFAQVRTDFFKHDGTVAWVRSTHVLDGQGFYDGLVRAYVVPPEASADVDDQLGLDYARWLYEQRQRGATT